MNKTSDTYRIGEQEVRDVVVRGYGDTEDDAFDRAMRVADKHHEVFTAKSIRKVRGQMAWDVTITVRAR
jgi:hypothetical protein